MAYRTVQFRISEEVLRIMREENGKPWVINKFNIEAVFHTIFGNRVPPFYMTDCINQIRGEVYIQARKNLGIEENTNE